MSTDVRSLGQKVLDAAKERTGDNRLPNMAEAAYVAFVDNQGCGVDHFSWAFGLTGLRSPDLRCAFADIELPRAEPLIGNIGGKKVGDCKGRPEDCHGVVSPRE